MNHLFIVGAQRSGSTYLYHVLSTHPQVLMARPARPEPKFFLDGERYALGRQHYEQTYFSAPPPGTRYFGEKSTSYIESPTAARRIQSFYPDARILMILRDPVERAWSNFRFSVEHGLDQLDFEAALAAEPERLRDATFATSVNPYAYRWRGHYFDFIEDYSRLFNRDQICILIFEEIVGNVAETQNLYRWLGVDDTVVPASLGEVFNATRTRCEMPPAARASLIRGYEKSLERLENHVGHRIEAWRRQWDGSWPGTS